MPQDGLARPVVVFWEERPTSRHLKPDAGGGHPGSRTRNPAFSRSPGDRLRWPRPHLDRSGVRRQNLPLGAEDCSPQQGSHPLSLVIIGGIPEPLDALPA